MSCDLCGKKGSTKLTRIEGVAYDACESCARHGESIKTVAPKKRFSRQDPNEQLILRSDASKVLRDARSRSGKTQSDLAKELGVKESEWQSWESGSRTPTVSLAKRIEKHLHVSLLQADVSEDVGLGVGGPSSAGLTIGDMIKRK